MSSRLVPVRVDPLEATIRPPGSKSLTIRSLFAAGLAEGTSRLGDPSDSGDTRAARGALRSLGVGISEGDGNWTVWGTGGALVPSPDPIDVGESGLTARSLIALGALVVVVALLLTRRRKPS